MPMFTIEKSYLVPVYKHETIEADSVEEACQKALESDDWENSSTDYETSRATYISGIWEGGEAYPGGAPSDKIPDEFEFSNERHT